MSTKQSDQIVVQAPASYSGSSLRIWRALVKPGRAAWVNVLLGVLAVLLISVAWTLVTGWYLVFGLLLVPYRLIRRGDRKRKVEAARHAEMLAAIEQGATR